MTESSPITSLPRCDPPPTISTCQLIHQKPPARGTSSSSPDMHTPLPPISSHLHLSHVILPYLPIYSSGSGVMQPPPSPPTACCLDRLQFAPEVTLSYLALACSKKPILSSLTYIMLYTYILYTASKTIGMSSKKKYGWNKAGQGWRGGGWRSPPPPGPWVYILLLTQPQKKYFASFYGKPSK
jgi:hypothetical protein